MSCKYNNSMYSLDVPEKLEYDETDLIYSIEEPYENTNEYFVESEPLDDYFDPSVEWEKVNHEGDHDWISYMEEYTKRVDLE